MINTCSVGYRDSMRYLYGDLSEFPLKENVLDMLSDFIEVAVAVLDLHHSIEGLLDSIEEDRRFLTESFEEIEHLHATLRRAFNDVIESRPAEDVVSIMAAGAADKVDKFLEDGKHKLEAKVEDRIARTQEEIGGLKADTIAKLERFFLAHSFPVSSRALRCRLVDGSYEARSEVLDMNGIKCGFSLDTVASGFFDNPRRFSDIYGQRVDFPVNTKKGWLKKEPVVQTVRLDDMFLTEMLDDDVGTAISMAPRTDEDKGGILVRVSKSEPRKLEVLRNDEAGGRIPVPPDLIGEEHEKVLLSFWQDLGEKLEELYSAKKRLLWIKVGGDDLLDSGLVPELVRRIVEYMAPTVREIDARSPAVEELCLKLEREDGKREEFYVEKAKLISAVSDLPQDLAALFDPLGLGMEIEEEERLSEEVGGGTPQVVEKPVEEAATVNSEVLPVSIQQELLEDGDEEDNIDIDVDSGEFDELQDEDDDFEVDIEISGDEGTAKAPQDSALASGGDAEEEELQDREPQEEKSD